MTTALEREVTRLRIAFEALSAASIDGIINAADYDTLQLAIDAGEAAGGGVVWVAPGTYHHNGLAITGATPLQFIGSGWASVLINDGAGAGITIGNLSSDQTNAVRVSGFLMDGGASHGVVMRRMHSAIIDNNRIRLFGGDGIRLEGSYASSAVENYVNNNSGSGIVNIALGTAQGTDHTRIVGNKVLANAAKGIWVDNALWASAGGHVLYNDIEGNAIGLQMGAGSLGNSDGWSAVGNYFESQTGLNMSLGKDGGTGYFRALSLLANKMSGSVSATQAMSLDHVQDAEIHGNLFSTTDFVVTANTTVTGWSGNLNSGGTFPTAFPNGGASFDTFSIRQSSSVVAQFAMASSVVRINYPFQSLDRLYAASAANPPAYQTASGMFMGNGVPDNATGNNGDYYFRGDGSVGSNLYKRSGGTWAAIL